MTDLVEQLENRIQELERELADSRQRNDEWLSIVSHDLRGPLTLIIGYGDKVLHQLRAAKESSRRIVEVEPIIAAAYRLDKMITQVVEGARLEGKQVVRHSLPTDLAPLIRETVRTTMRRYPTHLLEIDVPDALPLVDCDAAHVTFILSSLLSNATLFSPVENGVDLKAEVRRGWVEVSVTDRGLGVSEDERDHIFELRFRPERTRHVRRQGLGISLWIARELAMLDDGRLTVDSPGPDRGTTVTLGFQTLDSE